LRDSYLDLRRYTGSQSSLEAAVSEDAAMTGLAAEVAESSRQPPGRPASAWARSRATVATLACYLLGAFYVTGHLWINPVSRWQIGDVEDVNQATWFMRYTATAIRNARLPALTTTAMNAPHGVNLMWNTSLLLPGSVVAPVTWLFGPQVSLTVLLVAGFAGSAASMFFVLRRWGASTLAASLGGALYGFSPALVASGIGHYSLVLAILPPLLLDRVARIVAGRGSPVRNGLWLGLLAAAQLFISEEALVDTAIAAVILLAVLAISRPRLVPGRLWPSAAGLGTAAAVALVLCARALWVQFHGVAAKGAAATVIIQYNGRWTNLGTLPYAFITPARFVLLHTQAAARSAAHYPQPTAEYLAYLGVPLIVVLLAAIVYFWRHLVIRVAGVTCVVLEWLGLGARQLVPHVVTLPGFLLPWQYLQHLPVVGGMVPDRLCILADAGAAVVLAFSLDLARKGARPFGSWRHGAGIATAVAVIALLPVVPAPYIVTTAPPPPAGWQATFAALHLPPGARVLVAPFPYAGTSQVMRWQADTGEPATMIGGDFIAPDQSARGSRAGRSALTPTATYLDLLYSHSPQASRYKPSAAQIHADLATWRPAAVVADTRPGSRLGQFLIGVFGPPTTRIGTVLGWRR
jgi:hypothetical protein